MIIPSIVCFRSQAKRIYYSGHRMSSLHYYNDVWFYSLIFSKTTGSFILHYRFEIIFQWIDWKLNAEYRIIILYIYFTFHGLRCVLIYRQFPRTARKAAKLKSPIGEITRI